MPEKSNLPTAIAYYEAINANDVDAAAKYLHPDIKLISPLSIVNGKTDAVEALGGFIKLCNKVVIRARFSENNQVMLAADIHFPDPIGILRAAMLLQLEDGLIYQNEMFYDGNQIMAQKSQIFSK